MFFFNGKRKSRVLLTLLLLATSSLGASEVSNPEDFEDVSERSPWMTDPESFWDAVDAFLDLHDQVPDENRPRRQKRDESEDDYGDNFEDDYGDNFEDDYGDNFEDDYEDSDEDDYADNYDGEDDSEGIFQFLHTPTGYSPGWDNIVDLVQFAVDIHEAVSRIAEHEEYDLPGDSGDDQKQDYSYSWDRRRGGGGGGEEKKGEGEGREGGNGEGGDGKGREGGNGEGEGDGKGGREREGKGGREREREREREGEGGEREGKGGREREGKGEGESEGKGGEREGKGEGEREGKGGREREGKGGGGGEREGKAGEGGEREGKEATDSFQEEEVEGGPLTESSPPEGTKESDVPELQTNFRREEGIEGEDGIREEKEGREEWKEDENANDRRHHDRFPRSERDEGKTSQKGKHWRHKPFITSFSTSFPLFQFDLPFSNFRLLSLQDPLPLPEE